MKCPDCQAKISIKHYDDEYGWYECPKCEGCFTPDEIEEAQSGTSPRARREKASQGRTEGKKAPTAKGKKRLTQILEDEDAILAHEKEMLKPVVSREKEITHHRDEVATRQILNIIADEIELISEEAGTKIDRLNAREFYAMNLWRPLAVKHHMQAREKEIKMRKCSKHD